MATPNHCERNYRASRRPSQPSSNYRASMRPSQPSSNYRASRRPSQPSKKNPFGKRMLFDAVLTAFIVVEMFIQYTGTFLHEVIGAVFAVSIIVHLIIERKWIKGAARAFGAGRIAGKRKALAIVAVLLLACMTLLMVSSVIISTILFSFGLRTSVLNPGGIWYPIHTISSYALCAATVVHLAMHWSMVASFFKVPYSPSRRVAIGRGVGAMAAVGVVAIGVSAARALDVAEALADAGAEGGDSAVVDDIKHEFAQSNSIAADGETAASDQHVKLEVQDAQDPNVSSEDASSSEAPAASEQGASSSEAPSASEQGASSSEAPSASGQDASGVSPEITGICTLCKKRCPLSAPLCDKPYVAGLIPMP